MMADIVRWFLHNLQGFICMQTDKRM